MLNSFSRAAEGTPALSIHGLGGSGDWGAADRAPLEGTWTGAWTGRRGRHSEVPEGDGTVALPKLGWTVLCQPPE